MSDPIATGAAGTDPGPGVDPGPGTGPGPSPQPEPGGPHVVGSPAGVPSGAEGSPAPRGPIRDPEGLDPDPFDEDTDLRRAKVVTVSDGVVSGTREDRSGEAVEQALTDAGYAVVGRSAVSDGVASVAGELARVCAEFSGLVVTTGGTGFAPRDQTPEATGEILQRSAPGLAEAMRAASPLGPLSRGVAGVTGRCIVLNLPGSPRGAVESLAAVLDVLPHALDLLADRPTAHP